MTDRDDPTDNSTGRPDTAEPTTADARDPRISVVIPAFNAEAVLPTQLEALAAQTWRGWLEVIVADNGSTDGTRSVAEQFSSRLAHLAVIDASEHRGQAHAKNKGADAATGDVLLFLDADDEVHPAYVERMADVMRTERFATGRLEPFREGEAQGLAAIQADGPAGAYGFLPFAVGCSMALQREVFRAVGGFDPTMPPAEDVELSWRVQLHGAPLAHAPDAVVRYRLRTTRYGTYKQMKAYGEATVHLFTIYQQKGMPRRSTRSVLRFWLGGARKVLFARTRADTFEVAALWGFRIGLIRGSLRHRIRYL